MTQFVAALPMYDWPERRAEVDAEWAALRDRLRAHGVDAPERLVRRNADLPPVPGGIRDADGAVIAPDPATLAPDEFDLATLWRHPALLLAQTCWGPMQATVWSWGGTSVLAGRLSLDEVYDSTKLRLPEGGYDTLAGFVLDQLGHIPAVGDGFTYEGWAVDVVEMDGRRVASVRLVAPLHPEDVAGSEDTS